MITKYQFCPSFSVLMPVNTVQRFGDLAAVFIPLDPDNRDCAQFLTDWKAGAEVQNPDGTPAPYVAPEPK